MINRFRLLDEFAALQARLNEVLGDQLRDQDMSAGTWSPPVDIYETEDHIVVAAELPGAKREDIDVSVVGDKLILRGNKPRERDSEDEHFHRMERQYGSFYRTFNLPQVTETDAITARLSQGILLVTLPKRQSSGIGRIEVKDGS